MKDKLLHTPEGVRDIYNQECEIKLKLQNNLHQVLKHFGFRDIQTPSFEFFDIFSQERGTVASKDMYKFFDREGNTLVLRPDITPSIARCIAKYFKEENMPIRLCYMGNTYINNVGYQGKLKEATQLGAELINDDSIDADAEMLALTIECLLQSGLKEFQLEIGNADFFRALIEEAGFEEEDDVTNLRILIENKNMFGVEEIIMAKDMSPEQKEIFLKLPELFGTLDILKYAKELTKNERAVHAIERLEKLYEILTLYGFEKYVSFDLGMLSKYNYYTGIIFKAYTYGTGDAIATGGRYDNLVGQFGKTAPAIGLAIVTDQLMLALSRQKLLQEPEAQDTLILYTKDYRKQAIALAGHFRKDGINTLLQLSYDNLQLQELIDYGKRMNFGGILQLNSDTEIKVIDITTGDMKSAQLKEFLT
ncbi:ATP phosphoribosyltransferase regulatory subunit [Mobilitalea sibirica]|uniref:ATP phosphoribosyltransferase regulatory subunit n=1 Tax=Mobilitalea sibirica TaxID=1462919 RepID=A0A8J7H3U3_9FIRM|nr:ATP phosphoribosyltransferase regulatory subunit [Mobilitalea sibirica]MBH1941444.1 ATP phosphoribosyltransferase regulatory subunit [Mobilitalea sibirica]